MMMAMMAAMPAHEGESPIPRTAEQRRQDQDDDDEAQHGLAPPFFMCGKSVYIKRPASRGIPRNASLAFSLKPDACASADGSQPRFRVWLLPCYDDSISKTFVI